MKDLRGKIVLINKRGQGHVGFEMSDISLSNVYSVSLANDRGDLDLEKKIKSMDDNLKKAANKEGGKLHLTFTR